MRPVIEARAFAITPKEHREASDIYQQLRDGEAKLIVPSGKPEVLPNNLYSFLLRLLADLHAGHSVTILQNNHELTTIEAGKVLGMSRQYLVTLLEKGEIPFHLVGTHRRIYARDLFAYKAERDHARHKTLNALARQEYTEGIYDKVPDDFHSGQ
ncbi:MAG TPA: excisionase family DNA-binding protein [Terriglobales bacterium]|nr:excisionase family DNA-binding protein [Terriglobales bacterium]